MQSGSGYPIQEKTCYPGLNWLLNKRRTLTTLEASSILVRLILKKHMQSKYFEAGKADIPIRRRQFALKTTPGTLRVRPCKNNKSKKK
jgi:hypothetical protein